MCLAQGHSNMTGDQTRDALFEILNANQSAKVEPFNYSRARVKLFCEADNNIVRYPAMVLDRAEDQYHQISQTRLLER